MGAENFPTCGKMGEIFALRSYKANRASNNSLHIHHLLKGIRVETFYSPILNLALILLVVMIEVVVIIDHLWESSNVTLKKMHLLK